MSSAAEPYLIPGTLEDAETARLYEAYADRILAYCVRRLRSRSDAEDAVQTTFLYALRALRRGVEPECESAWLYTIARNVCSWQQRTAARRCPIADDFELESLACAETGEDVERLAGLRDALQSLPARQREALVLREWHGVPAREIAGELGLTRPQTHALLTRARQALAQALTTPGKAALGLGALAVGVRAQLKALLGGASVKAATVTAVVVAGAGVTGVTGAAAEESPAERAARERAIMTAAFVTSDVPAGPTVEVETQPAGTSPSGDAASPTAPAPQSPSSSTPVDTPAQVSVQLPPVTVELPGDVPPVAVPALKLPAVKLPAVKLPAVELPPVELLPVELPPVDIPLPVEVPPVQTPPVELPAVQVPSRVGPDPLVDIPPTQVVPPVTLTP